MRDELLNLDIINSLSDGVYYVDRDRKITLWNRAAEEITGYRASEVNDHYCFDNILQHVDDDGNELCKNGCPLSKAMDENSIKSAKVYLKHKKGYRVAVKVRGIPLHDDSGKVTGAIEIFSHFKDRDSIDERFNQLKELGLIDEITTLPKKEYIEAYITTKLMEKNEYDRKTSILILAIDKFDVYKNYGESFYETILATISKTLKNVMGIDDIIGNWDNGKFLFILDSISKDELLAKSNLIRNLIKKTGVNIVGGILRVSVIMAGVDIKKGDTIETINEKLEINLKSSLENGKTIIG